MNTSTNPSRAADPSIESVRLHSFYRGKVQVVPKVPIRGLSDFALWYTPGVAAASRAVAEDPDRVFDYTNKANSIAIVSDGSRVLGLGDIGPEAGLPVMEGKALLFKYLGGVDAVPICVETSTVDELVSLVESLQPSFGGINLEDIAQPTCFEALDRLRSTLRIPVWHDDQQGTATVVVAALTNALAMVDKALHDVDITLVGIGAANVATLRLLVAAGVDPTRVVACDRGGTLHTGRTDLDHRRDAYPDKWRICQTTNARGIVGGVAEALADSDVCLAFSEPGPDTIRPDWIAAMASDPVVFACANPVPEIWPALAAQAGARVVGTGRSDFPNQVNNSLAFPGIFRGVLDVRARSITDEMALAAADVLARFACKRGLEHGLLPTMTEWEVVPLVATATALTAQRQGVAALDTTEQDLVRDARRTISEARRATEVLMDAHIVPPPPTT